jgi:hypothetical protein
MNTEFSQKCTPRKINDIHADALMARWPLSFHRVLAMPPDQLDRLERKLNQLRNGLGVTVSQMALLRAIAARRVSQRFEDTYRKAGA